MPEDWYALPFRLKVKSELPVATAEMLPSLLEGDEAFAIVASNDITTPEHGSVDFLQEGRHKKNDAIRTAMALKLFIKLICLLKLLKFQAGKSNKPQTG